MHWVPLACVGRAADLSSDWDAPSACVLQARVLRPRIAHSKSAAYAITLLRGIHGSEAVRD